MQASVKTSIVKLLFLILCSVLMLFVPSFDVHAENIPNNSPAYSQGDYTPDNKPNSVDAADVFGSGIVGVDNTGLSNEVSAVLQTITNFLVSVANLVFIFGMIIYFVIESLMMAFPIIATLMATKVPIQLFSNECAKVCGVKYSYKPGGAQGGVGGGNDSGGVGGGDGKDTTFLSKFTTYAKERMITLIICGVILVMCATGLMPYVINTAINWILGLFFK